MNNYSESLLEVVEASNKILAGVSNEYNHNFENLYAPINYMFATSGKQIRGIFVLLSYQMFGGKDFSDFKEIVLAIETLHNFTLIHDDVMDNADLRRGMETINKKWSNNQAILSGDLLLMQSYRYLFNSKFGCISMYNEFNDTAIKICEGQQLDLDFQFIKEIKKEDYFLMIELKTAALIQLALSIPFYSGSFISQLQNSDLDNFNNEKIVKKLGLLLGQLFQIQDDYLDLYGQPSIVGKNIGGDIHEKKKTFLYVEACRLLELSKKEKFISLYNSDHNNKINLVCDLYDELDIKKSTIKHINQLYLDIFVLISRLKIEHNKKANLKEFVKYIMNRNC